MGGMRDAWRYANDEENIRRMLDEQKKEKNLLKSIKIQNILFELFSRPDALERVRLELAKRGYGIAKCELSIEYPGECGACGFLAGCHCGDWHCNLGALNTGHPGPNCPAMIFKAEKDKNNAG